VTDPRRENLALYKKNFVEKKAPISVSVKKKKPRKHQKKK
jgi:hypothetical protein